MFQRAHENVLILRLPMRRTKVLLEKFAGESRETIENRRHTNDSESALNFDLLDVDDGTQKVIVKFSPQDSSTTNTSSPDFFRSDQQILIDSSRAPVNISESPYIPPNSMLSSSIRPSYFWEGFVQSSTLRRLLERSTSQQSPNLFETASFNSLSVFINEISMNSIIFVTLIIVSFVRRH